MGKGIKTIRFQTICKVQSKGKTEIVIEDRILKNGHLYIRRETKTGAAAEKEIKKHSNCPGVDNIGMLLKDIIKEINESH